MKQNRSPWLFLLNRNRLVIPLDRNIAADVAVVGGGIAGITTAYFILKNTDKKVVLLEAAKVAHGATGHNAGYLASYFERPFTSLVEEYGLELAARAQRGVENSWNLLDEIRQEMKLSTPVHKFMGHAGCSTQEQLLGHLQTNYYRRKAGLKNELIFISKESRLADEIPEQFYGLYLEMPKKNLLSLVEAKNEDYVAVVSYWKGTMNSAMFTEELAKKLLEKFGGRFLLFEESPVKVISLSKDVAHLSVLNHAVSAQRVVLCTNGFDAFTIVNEAGLEIDTKFHHMVHGKIGYMAGYIDPRPGNPSAISYRVKPTAKDNGKDLTGDPYFYLTRRPHQADGKEASLVSIGGPEEELPEKSHYLPRSPFSEKVSKEMDEFLRSNYKHYPDDGKEFEFTWHGLMGYTPSGLRRIGPEPLNPVLLYNLGCNGIGILPSIYGSHRISMFIKGVAMKPSVFDPVDQSKILLLTKSPTTTVYKQER